MDLSRRERLDECRYVNKEIVDEVLLIEMARPFFHIPASIFYRRAPPIPCDFQFGGSEAEFVIR